jgi:hypothetical protein
VRGWVASKIFETRAGRDFTEWSLCDWNVVPVDRRVSGHTLTMPRKIYCVLMFTAYVFRHIVSRNRRNNCFIKQYTSTS